jgi:type I restriction-modification system DNA methylase subunit
MAKKNKTTDNDFAKAVERMAIRGNNQFSECFANFLDLALSFFCNNMNERQMELRAYMDKHEDFKNAYIDALNAFGDLAENYHDPLGDLFMDRISHGQLGQFFTPECVSELMANLVDLSQCDGKTISDPTCGSGRMLLKTLQIARDVHNAEPKIFANDISMACAKMTLLNLLINSVDGEVTCGDALRLDYENFKFFKIDKVRNLAIGAVLYTYWQYTLADVEEVSEKRQKWFWWIAEYGWIKYRHIPKDLMMFFDPQLDAQPMIDLKNEIEAPLPTEIKMGEQLSLFD